MEIQKKEMESNNGDISIQKGQSNLQVNNNSRENENAMLKQSSSSNTTPKQEPFRQAPSPSIKTTATSILSNGHNNQQSNPNHQIQTIITKPISLSLTTPSTNMPTSLELELMSLKPSKLERTSSTSGVLSDHESSMNEPQQTLTEKLDALQERSGEVCFCFCFFG